MAKKDWEGEKDSVHVIHLFITTRIIIIIAEVFLFNVTEGEDTWSRRVKHYQEEGGAGLSFSTRLPDPQRIFRFTNFFAQKLLSLLSLNEPCLHLHFVSAHSDHSTHFYWWGKMLLDFQLMSRREKGTGVWKKRIHLLHLKVIFEMCVTDLETRLQVTDTACTFAACEPCFTLPFISLFFSHFMWANISASLFSRRKKDRSVIDKRVTRICKKKEVVKVKRYAVRCIYIQGR